MNKYIIAYDLLNPDRDYPKLYDRLKKFEKYKKINESVWIIQTSLSIEEVKYAILCVVDTNDKIFILAKSWNYRTLGYNSIEDQILKAIITQ